VLIELSRSLSREHEFPVIEGLFKKNPELNYKLLKFMNSAAFYTSERISSVRQSLALLGYRNLQKWVTLLLFAGEGGDIKASPLLERAALRGRIMELLSRRIVHDAATADSAFMTGALSLIGVLLQMPINNVLDEFNLSQEINDALIHREGFLGTLILVTEMLEQENFTFIKEILEKYQLTLDDLFMIERDAIIEFETTNEGSS
jgi:c-di-GMP-related signal transduction protein